MIKTYKPTPMPRAVSESTRIPRTAPVGLGVAKDKYGTLRNTRAKYKSEQFTAAPEDTRSFWSDSRSKERGEAAWSSVKKVTAAAQYVPIPIVKYPAMAINSAMGALDSYTAFKSGDINNGYLNAIGAAPLPGSKRIKGLLTGAGGAVKGKLARAAFVASGIDAAGTIQDLTEKATGGFINTKTQHMAMSNLYNGPGPKAKKEKEYKRSDGTTVMYSVNTLSYQRWANKHRNAGLTEDGIAGDKTQASQKSHWRKWSGIGWEDREPKPEGQSPAVKEFSNSWMPAGSKAAANTVAPNQIGKAPISAGNSTAIRSWSKRNRAMLSLPKVSLDLNGTKSNALELAPDAKAGSPEYTFTNPAKVGASDKPYVKGAAKPSSTKKALSDIAPYASNIINSFSKPPKTRAPHLDSSVSATHVNMDNDRAMVERGVRGANIAADRNLDENTAIAVKASNQATRYNQLSDVNAKERNMNVGIDNETAKVNAQVAANNNAKRDAFDNSNVERGIAIKREQSANIANVGDKIVGIRNEKAKADLELKKYGILMSTDAARGVMDRKFDDAGNPIPKKAAMGGTIKKFNSKRMYQAMK
jgi:hypothetical protein